MTEVEAAQACLADQHAAIYVYGVLGGRTSQSDAARLFAALAAAHDAHRTQRDLLTARIRELGEEPVAAEVAYAVGGSSAPDDVGLTAVAVEQATAAAYAALVAAAGAEGRPLAIVGVADAAVRQVEFGGEVTPFPGADELAPG